MLFLLLGSWWTIPGSRCNVGSSKSIFCGCIADYTHIICGFFGSCYKEYVYKNIEGEETCISKLSPRGCAAQEKFTNVAFVLGRSLLKLPMETLLMKFIGLSLGDGIFGVSFLGMFDCFVFAICAGQLMHLPLSNELNPNRELAILKPTILWLLIYNCYLYVKFILVNLHSTVDSHFCFFMVFNLIF